jgi:hypothetical protein
MGTRHAPRLRVRTSGPEARLIEDALQAGLLAEERARLLLREPAMATGYPDLVAVYPRERLERRAPLVGDALRVLQLLSVAHRAFALAEVRQLLRMTQKALNNTVEALDAANLTRLRNATLSLQPRAKPFVATRIVAIEAKVNKWEAALAQACANTWFASHSYVLLPSRSVAVRAMERASELGVGVMAMVNHHVRTLVRPRTRRLPVSLGSWIVNEWMVQELASRDRC